MSREHVRLDLPDVCPNCFGPAWVEHTGSIMPGIGVPCHCVEDAEDAAADKELPA